MAHAEGQTVFKRQTLGVRVIQRRHGHFRNREALMLADLTLAQLAI